MGPKDSESIQRGKGSTGHAVEIGRVSGTIFYTTSYTQRKGLELGKLGDDGDLVFARNREGLRNFLPELMEKHGSSAPALVCSLGGRWVYLNDGWEAREAISAWVQRFDNRPH